MVNDALSTLIYMVKTKTLVGNKNKIKYLVGVGKIATDIYTHT